MLDRIPWPAAVRSIRFRIATQYSLALFGVASLLILAVNLALGQLLASPQMVSTTIISDPMLVALGLPPEIQIDQAITDAATLINRATLDNLHLISLVGLAALLPLSFVIGWLIAGRVLRPIDRISSVVRQIGATDLSRRIALQGPDDELRRMADTFDAMTIDRPYSKGMDLPSALNRLRSFVGTRYQSEVVEALVEACNVGDVANGIVRQMAQKRAAEDEMDAILDRLVA